MNEKEILEYNRKCAEFMELKKDSPNINWYYDLKKGRYFRNIELLYHSDWNWIMGVVEKIEILGYKVTITIHICRIERTILGDIIISEDLPKKEAVIEAINQFLTWYNDTDK